MLINSSPAAGNMCSASLARTVSLAGAMPPAPASFMQPFQMPTGGFGQWLFFDVTSVVVAN